MKKSKKFLLSALLLSPLITLTACVPPPSYLITASTYGSTWGHILGAQTEEKEENTKITMTAVELDEENHPFICWVKNYHKVCSTENALELTYNEETEGHYTAVFHENYSSMMFASLSEITITNADYSSLKYSLRYSSNSSGSNNYSLFSEGEFDPSEAFKTDNSSVLYFGPIGNVVEYKFEFDVTFANEEAEEETKTIRITKKLDNNSFANGLCQLSGTLDNTEISVNLKFEKISYTMYETQPEEQ